MISAIVVNHNGEDHLRRCLERLRLPWPELEILIVDNRSSDGTEALVERMIQETKAPIRYVKEHELGLSRARNRAIDVIRTREGRYVGLTEATLLAIEQDWDRSVVDGRR